MVGITTATIIILLSGGGADHYLTDLKGPLKEHVPDKERRSEILDAGKALSKDLKPLGKEIDEHFADFVRVHADYHSMETDFDSATARLVADQKKATQLMLDARDAMHEQMTREEWDAVFQRED